MEDLEVESDIKFLKEIARDNGIFLSLENAEYLYDIVSKSKSNQLWIRSISDSEVLELIREYFS